MLVWSLSLRAVAATRMNATCSSIQSQSGKCSSALFTNFSSASSSLSSDLPRPPRAYPSYRIYGEKCQIAMKLIVPTFVVKSGGTLSVKSPGRMLFDFTPRLNDNSYGSNYRYDYNATKSVALSAEEIGLILNSVSSKSEAWENGNFRIRRYHGGVTINNEKGNHQRVNSRYSDIEEEVVPYSDGNKGSESDIKAELTVKPTEKGTTECTIMFELITNDHSHMMELERQKLQVEVEAGEFEVLLAILRSSLTSLNCVWNTPIRGVDSELSSMSVGIERNYDDDEVPF